MTGKQRVIVRFYDNEGNHVRTDKFTLASYAGAWLRAMGYTAKGQATKGTYRSPEGCYAVVDYGR